MKTMNTYSTEKQLNELKKTIDYCATHSPFYKKVLKTMEHSEEFSLVDYKNIPFTTKEDLAGDHTSFCCVERKEIAEYVTTSGTTGDPISLFLTKNDLKRLAKNEKDSFQLMGFSNEDVFQLLTTIDKQFMAGLAYSLGVQELGGGMIRIGPGVPKLQWDAIFNYQPTVLIAVPSFIVTLIEFAKENNIDFNKSTVKSIVCIGEPLRNNDLSLNTLGKRISENWDVELFSTYASTEMGAAFSECTEHKGCHLNDDLLFLEVLDEKGNDVESGKSGEIVVTTLQTEGTPLIRYKTGDIATVYYDKCKCGSKTPRLGPIIGRKNQMIKFKGTTLYPKAIYDALEEFEQISCYKIIIDKNDLGNDDLFILLEDKLIDLPILHQIKERCKEKLRVLPTFHFVETNKLRGMVYKKHMRKPEKIIFK